jgi:hypothetical protein
MRRTPTKLAADIAEVKALLTTMVEALGVLSKAITEPEPASFTIAEFRKRHRLSESQYHKLKREGRGPRTMATGSVGVRISREADAAWVREREEEAAEAATAA